MHTHINTRLNAYFAEDMRKEGKGMWYETHKGVVSIGFLILTLIVLLIYSWIIPILAIGGGLSWLLWHKTSFSQDEKVTKIVSLWSSLFIVLTGAMLIYMLAFLIFGDMSHYANMRQVTNDPTRHLTEEERIAQQKEQERQAEQSAQDAAKQARDDAKRRPIFIENVRTLISEIKPVMERFGNEIAIKPQPSEWSNNEREPIINDAQSIKDAYVRVQDMEPPSDLEDLHEKLTQQLLRINNIVEDFDRALEKQNASDIQGIGNNMKEQIYGIEEVENDLNAYENARANEDGKDAS